ncbi:tRNA (guanine(37)-N1)-methyltransferase [Cephus cinctus]|uniref:tRNA (guanine(37)-N1)-methyltransferase n=1 Tax=Cephus cinctus TaxID=211228 RepID=A0AAJ7CDU2_CEPCN|nr:tRNA (guanine(37)-N1)-methyltransferase [Cephus cinctus]
MVLGGYLAAVLVVCSVKGQYRFHWTRMASLLVPPASVRGMTCLDRDAFTTTTKVPHIKLGDVQLAKIMPVVKKYMLKLQKLKPVQDTENGKIVYIDPQKVKSVEDIPEDDRILLSIKHLKELEKIPLTLTYENWRQDEVLKAILPENVEVPTSYSIVGHIIHLNLRDSQLPYRNIIGEVFLDKINIARTVVNKLNVIDTTFRHFKMEILAGEDNTTTIVKENGFTYEFDFAHVYWNPRLGTEHMSLTASLKRNDVLYDVFAGVGPFAVPAARRGAKVLANDLNPESYKWLQRNAKINKVQSNLKTFNKDGRDFLRYEVKADLIKRRNENIEGNEYIAMNLPALAIEFLDVITNCWFSSEEVKSIVCRPPTVHLYCFVKIQKDEDPHALAKTLVEKKLGCSLCPEILVTVRHVRNVSPNKEMMRVSFLLTKTILQGEEPAKKKAKMITDNIDTLIKDNVVGSNGKEQGSSQDQKCIQGGRSS